MPQIARALRLMVLASGLLAASAAGAASLDSARTAGLVGERPDGLVGLVTAATPDVEALVKDVNARRLAQYQDIARRTGTSLPAVQAVAGAKAIEQAPSGSFVMDGGGHWRRK